MRPVSARQLVALAKDVARLDLDLYSADLVERLRTLPSWDVATPAALVESVVESLRAMEILERETPEDIHRVSVAFTAPVTVKTVTIADKLRTLIAGAGRELLVIGFDFGDAEFAAALHRAARRRVTVTVVGDAKRSSLRRLIDFWPSDVAKMLRAYVGAEPRDGDVFRVHAKTVVADRRTTFVGSSNFTAGGLRNNFEIGVVLDGTAGREIADVVDAHIRLRFLVHPDSVVERLR